MIAGGIMSEKVILLKASNENWSMMGPGSWTGTEWFVFTDRSYKAVLSYIPDRFNDYDFTKREVKEVVGTFSEADYSLLCAILDEEWLDPSINSDACDGEAWQIKTLYPSGRTKKTSGKLGYIYFQPIERLVGILNKQLDR